MIGLQGSGIMAERLGITAGCFDLFHAGHVLMLNAAKSQCDFLVVALQTDPTIDRPEKNKPVQSMFERYAQVAGCKFVDKIIPYDTEEDLLNILTNFLWDIRILGSDYKDRKDYTGYGLDIPIYFANRNHNYSSTNLRTRIKTSK